MVLTLRLTFTLLENSRSGKGTRAGGTSNANMSYRSSNSQSRIYGYLRDSMQSTESSRSKEWAAAGFKDTLLRCQMKREVANGDEKKIQPGVQA